MASGRGQGFRDVWSLGACRVCLVEAVFGIWAQDGGFSKLGALCPDSLSLVLSLSLKGHEDQDVPAIWQLG